MGPCGSHLCSCPCSKTGTRLLIAGVASPFWVFGSIGNDDLGPAQHKFWLLARIAGLALLGDAERVHPFQALAADALVQGRVIGRTDDCIIAMNAMAKEGGLDLAGLHFHAFHPSRARARIRAPAPSRHNSLQADADLQELVDQGQRDPLFAVELLPKLLVSPLRVAA